jgi:hypothetical protein
MSEKFIVRFPEDQVIWLSSHLYKAPVPEEYSYNFWFDFEGYYELIGKFYKTPQHFDFKATVVLSSLLNRNLDKIVWNSSTGYPDIKASGKYLYLNFLYSAVNGYSSATIKKILLILEELSVLKISHKSNGGAYIKLYLQKLVEFLKRGTEDRLKAMRRIYEMNNIDFDEIEYLREEA